MSEHGAQSEVDVLGGYLGLDLRQIGGGNIPTLKFNLLLFTRSAFKTELNLAAMWVSLK